MVIRRGAIALTAAAALTTMVWSTSLLAQRPQPQQVQKMSKAQENEIKALNALLDGVTAGQPAPNDLSLAWVRDDLLKAQGNKQYVPFTVTFDPSKTSSKTLTVYWRVVPKNAAPPPPPDPKDKNAKPAPQEFAYVDMNTTTVTSPSGPARLSRSFAASGGTYDVFVVVKEPTPEKQQRNAPPLKTSVLKQTVEIPDLWNNELNTSSVFVAERIDPLPAPLTPQQQAERPYALGTMEIVPRTDMKFSKGSELSTFLLVYNAQTDKDNKPDVSVEFNFYAKQADGEKFFNKTNPQNLNASTLPPGFDFAAGHQLQAGQAVPLGSFPEGNYRLEIKVTDKLANKSVTRDVNFSVAGS